MDFINQNYKKLSFFFIIIFYFLIAINNQFPQGYFFASGDNYQVINFQNFFEKKLGVWEYSQNGRVNNNYYSTFYYFIVSNIFSLLSISETYSSVALNFTYLFFSFLSFYFSLKFLKINLNFANQILLSICYSINFFVFYIFWYTWGYTTTILYYIFAPILISSFYAYIIEENFKKKLNLLVNLTPIIFLSNISYGNIAWLLINLLICSTIFSIYIFPKLTKINFKFALIESGFFILFLLVLLTFNFISIYLNFLSIEGSSINNNLNSAELFNWLFWQSQPLPSAFFFIRHFASLNTMGIFQYLTIFNFVVLFFLIYKIKDWNTLNKIFVSILVILILITFKGIYYLPEFIISFFFGDTFFYSFRSEDKSSLLLPYFVFTLIAFYILKLKRNKKIFTILLVFINLSSSYPLIFGGIHKDHGINIDKIANSPFKSLKQIDEDLLNIQKILNSDIKYQHFNVLEAPYSVTNSKGWNDFLNYNHRGISFVDQFTKMQLINLNSNTDLIGKNVLPEWNRSSENNIWDINILQILSIKYIINHKSVPKTKYSNKNKFSDLETQNIITKIYSGKNIDLYKLNDEYLNQKIYLPQKIISGNLYNEGFSQSLFSKNENIKELKTAFLLPQQYKLNTNYIKNLFQEKKEIKENKEMINYQKNEMRLENDKYKALKFNLYNSEEKFYVVFTQNHNKFWKLKCLNCKNNQQITQLKINQSMNGWIIQNNNQNKLSFEIEFVANKFVKIYHIFLLSVYILMLWIKRKFLF